jgi:hypothetical protein
LLPEFLRELVASILRTVFVVFGLVESCRLIKDLLDLLVIFVRACD